MAAWAAGRIGMQPALRDPNPPLTRSVEDYLKAIYHLSSQGGFAATSDIAAMLEVAPPSVSGMVKRLSETGLIEHVPYRGVQLTSQARRAALRERAPAIQRPRGHRAGARRGPARRGAGAGAARVVPGDRLVKGRSSAWCGVLLAAAATHAGAQEPAAPPALSGNSFLMEE